MTAPNTNRALWQDAQGAPGAIRESPLPTVDELGDRKVLVKAHCWAVNPCDYMLQDRDLGRYPAILGCDVAGTVAAVAPGSAAASKFRVGDAVFGFNFNNCFQDYVVLEDRLMAKVPDGMALREAVVSGLCAATGAMYLFGKNYLHLESPMLGSPRRRETVLVWGGGSAVGSNAIQLATSAGYDVVTTCSGRNFDYVRGLGAVQAFDYNNVDVVADLAAELDKGVCVAIFMAAGLKDGNVAALKVAAASKQTIKFASSAFIDDLDSAPDGVDIKQPSPGEFVPFPDCWLETAHATFGGFLPEALAKGAYKAAPPPLVVNRKGLEGLQEAVDMMRTVSEKGQDEVREVVESAEHSMKQERKASAFKLVVERPPGL